MVEGGALGIVVRGATRMRGRSAGRAPSRRCRGLPEAAPCCSTRPIRARRWRAAPDATADPVPPFTVLEAWGARFGDVRGS